MLPIMMKRKKELLSDCVFADESMFKSTFFSKDYDVIFFEYIN